MAATRFYQEAFRAQPGLAADLSWPLQQPERGLAECLECLRHAGLDIPMHPTKAQAQAEFERICSKLHGVGIDELAVTNLDGLDQLETIKVCVAYKLGSKTLEVPPSDLRLLVKCKPVYVEFPGWMKSTADAKTFEQLPPKARNYLKKIAALTGGKLSIVSVGAARAQTIRL